MSATLALAQFLAIPEQKPALELNPDGSIQQKTAAGFPHAIVQVHLGYLIVRYLDEHPDHVGHAVSEVRITMGGASRVADFTLYLGERPDLGKAGDALRVADLVAEILSPSDSREEQRAKCRWYVEQGARVALLLDPESEVAEFFGPVGVWEAYVGQQCLPLDELLPGVELSADAIFAILHRH